MAQKTVLDKFIDTSRYIYNKTIDLIENKGHKVNFYNLRDILVTENSKKTLEAYKAFDAEITEVKKQKNSTDDEKRKEVLQVRMNELQQERRNAMKKYDYIKNTEVMDFELETPKDIRACAVNRCCDAYKTGFSNLRNGHIRFFKMHFKRKKEKAQTLEVTPKLFQITQNGDFAMPCLGDDKILRVHNKMQKRLKLLTVDHNVDIVRSNSGYYVHLSVATKATVLSPDSYDTVAGIDLGIRTFGTGHINSLKTNDTTIVEYKHRADLLKKWNQKIKMLKTRQGRVRKKQFSKLEKAKKDLVDLLHWEFIKDILSRADVIYLGDIKSHDIVSGGRNRTLNQNFNDLKFYQLKARLMYKAGLVGKRVELVPEPYTTKTCSCCGEINNNVGSKEVFTCSSCHLVAGRDINASKNMKMKGLLQ